MHAAHPEYEGRPAFAHVIDGRGVLELAFFTVQVDGVDLDDLGLP